MVEQTQTLSRSKLISAGRYVWSYLWSCVEVGGAHPGADWPLEVLELQCQSFATEEVESVEVEGEAARGRDEMQTEGSKPADLTEMLRDIAATEADAKTTPSAAAISVELEDIGDGDK